MTISNAHLIPCFTFCIPLSHLSHSCVPVLVIAILSFTTIDVDNTHTINSIEINFEIC